MWGSRPRLPGGSHFWRYLPRGTAKTPKTPLAAGPVLPHHVFRIGLGGFPPISPRCQDHCRDHPTRRCSVATQMIIGSSYPCPHCQVPLAVLEDPWHGWVLCPDCGRPCLPPERLPMPEARRRATIRQPGVPQGDGPAPVGLLNEANPMVELSVRLTRPASASSASRLIVSTGLFVSAFLLLVAYLDRSSHSMGILGALTVVFLFLRLRMPRGR
jgi:hypothetical protein